MTDRQILMLRLGKDLAEMFQACLSLPSDEYHKLWGFHTEDEEDPHYGQPWRCKYWDRVAGCLEELAIQPMDEPVEEHEIAWAMRGLRPRLFNEDGSRTDLTMAEACSNA